jgi:hypothetical protein
MLSLINHKRHFLVRWVGTGNICGILVQLLLSLLLNSALDPNSTVNSTIFTWSSSSTTDARSTEITTLSPGFVTFERLGENQVIIDHRTYFGNDVTNFN